MQTWHIHVEGGVQGVGFRPFVYRLAREFNIYGNVSTAPNGVHIHVSANREILQKFTKVLKEKAPPAARVLKIIHRIEKDKIFDHFSIVENNLASKPKLQIPPDFALCDDCRIDVNNKKNRRNNYAFTNCAICGPRFSILEQLPYDRKNTSLNSFEMCEDCQKEYLNTNDRRFYSQTQSCSKCGLKLRWLTNEKKHVNPIEHAVALLVKGKIVAVKGMGGFLLLADATNAKAIKKLRARKNRPIKPLACLFKNIKQLGKFAKISPQEETLLTSPAAPIVLLKIKKKKRDLALKRIAPGLRKIGAMLPSSPILELITKQIRVPLVATSAKVSGAFIAFKNEDALNELSGIADAILSDNLEIKFSQNHSVIAVTPTHGKKIMLRRGLGFAPNINLPNGYLPDNILAMGAETKSAFGFAVSGYPYLSQYLGDTASSSAQQAYNYTFNNFLEMLKPEIEGVIIDNHPNFFSAKKGVEFAKENDANICKIQHHKAHFGAILAEHQLLKSKEQVLGVVWDSTGFGEDGNLWGGEFFTYANQKMQRVHHLGYMPIISKNRMAYEPPVATLSAMWPENPGKVWVRKTFTEEEQLLLPQIAREATQFTSSVGRLFDAVAGLLNIKRFNSFDGESALALQAVAEKSKLKIWHPYCLAVHDNVLESQYLLLNLDADYKNKKPVEDLALRFHQTLVQWIKFVADTQLIDKIAFSGGVFQNSLLVDLIIERLGKTRKLYFHETMPPTDENIAVGQLALSQFISGSKRKSKNTAKITCA